MKKILLIEDNHDMRENIAELLELSGYSVITAEHGKIGVQKAIDESPDLIICDIMMPELDGYGVLHILSKNPNTSHTPFLFLSAKSENVDLRKGMNLGADDYLTKPFEELELLNAVEARLKRNEQLTSGDSEERKDLPSLEKLVEKSPKKVVKNKAIIYNEGDPFRYLYHVNKGKVRIFKSHEAGKEFTTKLFGNGEWCGLSGIFDKSTYDHSAQAIEETEIHLVEKESFLEVLYHSKVLVKKVLEEVLEDLGEKEKKLVELAYNSVRRRVADALIEMYDKYAVEGEKYFIKMPRESLASIAGTSTESAIRMLSEFKDSGLITTSKLGIELLDIEKLRSAPY